MTAAPSSDIGLIEAMWRYRWSSLAIVVLVTLLTVLVGYLAQPGTEVRTTIALATPPPGSVMASGIQGDASLQRYTAQRAAFVLSDAVIERVAVDLGRADVTALRRDLAAVASEKSNSITITARADSASEAVDLARATVNAYRNETLRRVEELTDEAVRSIEESQAAVIEQAQARGLAIETGAAATTVRDLNVQASQLRASSALFGDSVEFVTEARIDAVTEPSLGLREAALGLVVGLALAAAAAWSRADRARAALEYTS